MHDVGARLARFVLFSFLNGSRIRDRKLQMALQIVWNYTQAALQAENINFYSV